MTQGDRSLISSPLKHRQLRGRGYAGGPGIRVRSQRVPRADLWGGVRGLQGPVHVHPALLSVPPQPRYVRLGVPTPTPKVLGSIPDAYDLIWPRVNSM